MFKQVLFSFAVAALSVASAETFRVTLAQPSVIQGTQLKAGDYKLTVKDASVVIVNGKTKVEVPAKVSSTERKFDTTRVLYNEEKGKATIEGIEFGGTRTRLQFDSGVQAGGGQ
jgi:lipopolysaccharide export system protein LptA